MNGPIELGHLSALQYRRTGRLVITVLLPIVTLTLGLAGGHWLTGQNKSADMSGSQASGDPTSTSEGDWYTCGMHPNVLQKGPGLCPICQMKLTPLKEYAEGDSGSQSNGSKERKVLYWRAPMDPNYVSDKPGKSPMGMDLVPVYADKDESTSGHAIRINPITVQNMGIRTAVIQRGPLIKTIRTVGHVDYDEKRVTFIDTKFNGWIDKLNVDETGQFVAKGDPLFDVYSPELYAAQEEYLAAARSLPLLAKSEFAPAREQAALLVEAAATKLRYMDVSDAQIDNLRTAEKIEKNLTIYSPSNGIVTEKMALEGMYVKPGMRLYTIADLSRIWVYVDVYEYELPWVRVGQTAKMTLSYIPGEEFVGKVVYVYPYLEKKTRVIQVRLEFDNPALELKPGMFANVKLEADLQKDAVLIPREAYIDSGTRKVAFVDLGEGRFSPRDIQVGVEAEDGLVEVLYGVDAGEVVVISGQFMLDAESKLKEAVAKMMEAQTTKTTKRPANTEKKASHSHEHGGEGTHSGHEGEHAMSMPPDAAYACPMEQHPDEPDLSNQGPYFSAEAGECPRCGMKLKTLGELSWTEKYKHDAAPVTAPAENNAIPEDVKFACPMEKHPDEVDSANQGPYFSVEPGKCPRCGMKLKPVGELAWAQARLAAKGGDMAYTCPSHQHVFSDQSGQCPRCGKTLAPFKVMYTCPDPKHAGVVSSFISNCPRCAQGLAAFRSVWLDPSMAEANLPTNPGLADVAPWRCLVHPLVHSADQGNCTICAAELRPTQVASSQPTSQPGRTLIPSDAAYVCPMEECWHFSAKSGQCPICEMKLKPINQVAWAKEALAAQARPPSEPTPSFVCPMHREKIHASRPSACSICGMQLVHKSSLKLPEHPTGHVGAQVDYIMEHYLELQKRLASDSTSDVALHALGLASASEQLVKHLKDPGLDFPPQATVSAERIHTVALRTTGVDIEQDRVAFVEMSSAVQLLMEHIRPSAQRWPKLYIYHCPMSNGNWLQATDNKANPYYGFKMLKCGELQNVK